MDGDWLCIGYRSVRWMVIDCVLVIDLLDGW